MKQTEIMKDKMDILIEKIAEQGTDEIQSAFFDFQEDEIKKRKLFIEKLNRKLYIKKLNEIIRIKQSK